MREVSDAVSSRGAKWLRGERTAHVADHNIGSPRSHPCFPTFTKPARHPDERYDGGDTDGDAQQRQPGSHRSTDQSAYHDRKKCHFIPPVIVTSLSGITRPSFICTV